MPTQEEKAIDRINSVLKKYKGVKIKTITIDPDSDEGIKITFENGGQIVAGWSSNYGLLTIDGVRF